MVPVNRGRALLVQALIVGALKDSAALAACPWLPTQHAQQAAAQGASPVLGPSPAALRDAVVLCARNSAHGQGGIVQPMAQLAVALMEAGAGDKAACYLLDGRCILWARGPSLAR